MTYFDQSEFDKLSKKFGSDFQTINNDKFEVVVKNGTVTITQDQIVITGGTVKIPISKSTNINIDSESKNIQADSEDTSVNF